MRVGARITQVREILPTTCGHLVILGNYMWLVKNLVLEWSAVAIVSGWALAIAGLHNQAIQWRDIG